MKRHVAAVAAAEVGDRVFRPLIGFRQQHAIFESLIDVGAQGLEEVIGLRQILAVGAFAFVQIGHGIQAHAVHSHVEPVIHHPQHGPHHVRILEIQVRLVGIEAMPKIGFGDRIPGPVRGFKIAKDDAGVAILVGRVAPHVEIAPDRAGLGGARFLKPPVLVGGVIEYQLGDDAQAAAMRLAQHQLEIAQRAVLRMHGVVVGDVIAVITQRRGIEGQQPERGHAQALQVVELLQKSLQITHAVIITVAEALDVQFIDDGILEPQWLVQQLQVVFGHRFLHGCRGAVSQSASGNSNFRRLEITLPAQR